MPIAILMPALSPTMTEGTLVKWHKKPGEKIKSGETLFDIQTDKAIMEVEAADEGIVAQILVEGGSAAVPVGKPIAVLLEEDESSESLEPFLASLSGTSESVPAKPEIVEEVAPVAAPSPVAASHVPLPFQGRQSISPLAKKIAQDHGIDVSALQGSGPRGRIVKKDIEAALSLGASSLAMKPSAAAAMPTLGKPTLMPLTPMRKVIAQRLTESKQTIPHFYLSVSCKMDTLLSMRQSLNDMLGKKDISVNDILVRACALALGETPEMNAQWVDNQILQYPHVELAVAVSIDGGLITPIVRGAEHKSLKHLVTELKDLIARAREGRLQPQEFQGGTFTMSNLGMYGIEQFQAIINPPHSGILAVGATTPQPVVLENGTVGTAQIMKATLAADHRIVDGSTGAIFLTKFKKYVENPSLLLY